jgi:hypothetical protein
MARRYLSKPAINASERSSVPAHLHPRIDALLKELRNTSRRLRTTLASCSDELRILERLYYKGKNQHRSAIFWRHVVEMRRYGSRLAEADVFGLVNNLRHTFHATTAGDGWVTYRCHPFLRPLQGFAERRVSALHGVKFLISSISKTSLGGLRILPLFLTRYC